MGAFKTVVLLLFIWHRVADETDAALDARAVADKITHFRIHGHELYIEDLEKKIDLLEKEASSVSETYDDEFKRVEARVGKLQGSPCLKKELFCGEEAPKCIHHLLVCDGHKDCENGHDEDERVCSAHLIRTGSTFEGYAVSHDGIRVVSHLPLVLSIRSVRESTVFSSHTRLFVTFETEYLGQRWVYDFEARYVHATRRLYIGSGQATEQPFTIKCQFEPIDDNHMTCTGHYVGSMHKTISYKFERV